MHSNNSFITSLSTQGPYRCRANLMATVGKDDQTEVRTHHQVANNLLNSTIT